MTVDSKVPIDIPADLAPYIFPGEQVVNIEYFATLSASRPPSGLRELYRLAQAKIDNKLYKFNPPLASLALESNDSLSPEIHSYEALFGRDSLRVSMDLLAIFPQLTHATLHALASSQGLETYAAREEEPGRIPHEIRNANDSVAKKLTAEYGWGWPYYGSVDATPEFIRTVAAYANRTSKEDDFFKQEFTDKSGATRTIFDAFDKAVDWVISRTGANPEGLLESKTVIPQGIQNQMWKDSWDAYFHHDGQIANHEKGVASVEVQRLAYDALLDAAELYEARFHMHSKAEQARNTAKKLRESIFGYFWTSEHGGYFVLGTDRDESGKLRQLAVRTSNMGHLLHSRLLTGNEPQIVTYREAVVRHLFSPEMLTPSGIRTLASDEKRYRPGAYHNGSVWLWDTHFIAKGLRRHGYLDLADQLSERLFNIINATHTFPEFVRGDSSPIPTLNHRVVDIWDTTYERMSRIEQPPQEVQAWSVAAILALKHYNDRVSDKQRPEPGQFEQGVLRSVKSVLIK